MGEAVNANQGPQAVNYKLEDKVTKESKAIELLQEGYIQSFVDFFYLTNETTPPLIEPSEKLLE